LNKLASFAYGLWGPRAEARAARDPEIQKRLYRAHLPLRAGAFLAASWLVALLAGLWSALFVLLVLLALHASPILLVALPLLAGALLGAWTLTLGQVWLANRAREVAKDVDDNLPAGLSYMLALANAGMPPAAIWGSLANAKAFGALAFEAERIRRDLSLFSLDVLTALRHAQERTPSKRFHEFLQGAISSFQSGVELETYLKTKGEQYQHEAQDAQLRAIDTMGVMAEAFLVVVVAAPLFLMILLTVMAVNQGAGVLPLGFALALVFMPLAQITVGALMQGANPRGSA